MSVKVAAQLHRRSCSESFGPPVLILHGLFGSAGNWRSVSRALSRRFEVHALDMRNHGASPHDDSMTYADMANDILDYLDDNICETPSVIGHSMGGKAAMHLSLAHGDRISKLIVVDVAPVPNHQGNEHILTAMSSVDIHRARQRNEVDRALADLLPDNALRQFLLQNLVRGNGGYRWRLNLQALRINMDAILDFPLPPIWQSYEKPTLFIRGERSSYVRSTHNEIIKMLFPNADIVTIADAGHWVHAEQTQHFLNRVGSFLEG